MDSKDKVNIEHPIVHLEEKIQFLKLLQETLVASTYRVSENKDKYLSKTEEQIQQYERAVEILKYYHSQ